MLSSYCQDSLLLLEGFRIDVILLKLLSSGGSPLHVHNELNVTCFLKLHIFISICAGKCAIARVRKSEDSFWEFAFPFWNVGLGAEFGPVGLAARP